MARLEITFEPPEEGAASAVMHVDATDGVATPLGRVVASTLEIGDEVFLVPKFPYPATVQLIEVVEE